MTAITIRTDQRHQQTLTPRLQHAVRLLQLSSLDFAQEVQAALGKNPFLETPEDDEDESFGQAGSLESMPAGALSASAAVEAPADADREPWSADDSSAHAERDDVWAPTGLSSGQRPGDGETSAMDLVPADTPLRQHLHGQLNVMPLSERDLVLAKVVVESLDDDGYLRESLPDLLEIAELEPPPGLDEMQVALALVQSLDPCGVGARSVPESLLLQLQGLAPDEDRDLARQIVQHHLERLARRDVAGLARLLERPVSRIERVCDRIRHLDPRPGWRYGASAVHYVTPDVLVRKVRGEWSAVLNTSIVPRVRLNKVYADLFQRHRDGQHTELAAHLQEARWTVRNVEQRFATILSVTQAIIKRQKHFLEYGALAMKPLGLREIAEEVGIHESTVSRVTNNKYMATPVGVFELKYFFSRAMPTSGGGACSATAIRGLIQTMIDEEKASAPLSDAEIARRLMRQGLSVARRTVTKYRQALRIAPVDRRRRLA